MSVTLSPPPPVPLAGCAPPDGLAGLIQCYDDINAAMDFLSRMIIDLINNNPAVAEAIIQAIEKSGSALPLLGVTNGTPAVSPQVGEYIQLTGTMAFPSTGAAVREQLSLGVIPAGDWDCWLWATFTSAVQGALMSLNPLPAGFTGNPVTGFYYGPAPQTAVLPSMTVRGLVAVPTLIVVDTQVAAISGQSGTMTVNFSARRRR